MARILFKPQDTLFFRDGQPFNQGESCAGLASLFPPSPFTMVGAARTAWSRAMGWSGIGPWKKQLSAEQLQRLGGDGPELTGLTFRGPLLMHKEASIFPAPACLIGITAEDRPEQVIRLYPSQQKQHCDMGKNIQLPVPKAQDNVTGRKLLEGWWLNEDGFSAVLAGRVPQADSYIKTDTLWNSEPRVGISIDHALGQAEESALYSIQHIRLNSDIELAMTLDGNLHEFPGNALVPLGGEARTCWLRTQKDTNLGIPECGLGSANSDPHYAVHILTPLKPEQRLVAGKSFAELPGKVISACLPRPQRWGGWDTINRCPLPMSPCLAPGSVIFMEVKNLDQVIEAKQFHGTTIGLQKSWGFGLIAIGQW